MFLALFTGVRGRRIPRSSQVRSSPKLVDIAPSPKARFCYARDIGDRLSLEHDGRQGREGEGYGRYMLSGSYLTHVCPRTL
jgi:hypothetical protein